MENNNFHQDLSFLKDLVGLKALILADNKFYGSLEFLKDLRELLHLDINNTDIDGGLEYLPDSLEEFYCSTKWRKDAKVKTIYDLFANEQGKVEADYFGIKHLPKN